MSKSTFRTVEFSLSIFSVICIMAFLILGGRLNGDIFLWILTALLILSVFQAFNVYLVERETLSKELLTKKYLKSIVKYAFTKNRMDSCFKIIQILLFIYLSCIYENGILLVPFIVSLFFTSIQRNMEEYDKSY